VLEYKVAVSSTVSKVVNNDVFGDEECSFKVEVDFGYTAVVSG
jgi:hypothetical protein